MRSMNQQAGCLLTLAMLSIASAAPAQRALLAPAGTISVPGVQGGFNHMSVDAKHRLLFATASTNGTLEVIDLAAGKPSQTLAGEKPAAALYAPEFNQWYVTRGQSVAIYDGDTLAPMGSIDLHSNLDELHYDPRAKELYVGLMSEGRTGIGVISIPARKLAATIPLPSKPQGFVVELTGDRIFANTPVQQQVAVVDRKRRAVLAPLSLGDLQSNFPIALDEAHHRLFVGVRHPAKLVVFDTDTGRQVAALDINGDTDDLSFDPLRDRIYISCGEGFVDVVQQLDPQHYELSQRIATASGARTSTFSAALGEFFVAVPRRDAEPLQILLFRAAK